MMTRLYTTLIGCMACLLCSLGAAAQQHVVLVEEHFDKFTRGTEGRPDKNDMCLEELDWHIMPSLTEAEGWNGGGIYQAGGCAYIYAYSDPQDTEVWYLGYLETPRFDTTEAGGEFKVRFRARSVLKEDWLGVCGVPANQKEAQQKFAVISDQWATYEVTLGCGDDFTCVQFEPLDDGCFIDDIMIYYVLSTGPDLPEYALEMPVVLPVEDCTPEGYTARWQPVRGAEDYAVYDYLYYRAAYDGDAFDYINTDFSLITQGSLERPVTIPGTVMGMAYLDAYTGRSDWAVFGAGQADGCLAFAHGAGLSGTGINSPVMHIADPTAPVHVSFRSMSHEVSELLLSAYNAGDRMVMEEIVSCDGDWTTHQYRIDNPSEALTLYLEVEYGEPGYYYIDDLHVWQELPAGTVARVPTRYLETADTSVYIHTPENDEGYRHAFSVSAYAYTRDEEGDVIDYAMSPWSAPVFADGQGLDAIRRPLTPTAPTTLFDIYGRRITPSATSPITIDGAGRKRMR